MAESESAAIDVIDTSNTDIVALTEALLRNPDQIRKIQFDGLPEFDDTVLEELKQSIGDDIGEEVLDNLVSDDDDEHKKAFLEVLLFYARNVEELCITLELCFDFVYFNSLHEQYGGDSNFLTKLRKIDVRSWDTECGIDLAVVTPLLKLGQVTAVHAFSCDAFEFGKDWTFPDLRQVDLQRAALSVADGSLLVCKGDLATTREISQALLPLHKTLRKLHIYSREHSETFDLDQFEPINSLQSMNHLETLELWLYDLVAEGEEQDSDFVSKLPESLKTIAVSGAEFEDEVLETLAAVGIELVELKDY